MDEVLVVGVGQLLRFGVVDLGEDERGKRRGAGRGGRGVFCQDCSAVGDTGAVKVILLVLPGLGKGRRTKGAEWRRMRMPF